MVRSPRQAAATPAVTAGQTGPQTLAAPKRIRDGRGAAGRNSDSSPTYGISYHARGSGFPARLPGGVFPRPAARRRPSDRVLPSPAQVGGIKDKVLAAHRAGLKRVILPQRNEKDLEEIPGNVRQDLSFVTASCLDDVLNAAFDGGFAAKSSPLANSKL